MKLDLHIHTCFSDGKLSLEEVLNKFNDYQCISITDHNTLKAYFSSPVRRWSGSPILLPGVELRLYRKPDYLVFFPRTSLNKLDKIQKELDLLEEADHDLTAWIAQNDYFIKDIDSKFAFLREQHCRKVQNPYMGTDDLASIIDSNDNSYKKLIGEIRVKKGKYITKAMSGKCPGLSNAAKIMTDFCPYSFAQKHDGEIVLAHPLKEVVYTVRSHRNGNSNKLDINIASETLKNILGQRHCEDYCDHGYCANCQCIEYATDFSEIWWQEKFQDNCSPKLLQEQLLSFAKLHKLNLTPGSDLHNLEFNSPQNMNDQIAELYPAWLSSFLANSHVRG